MRIRNHTFVPVLSAAFLLCIAPAASHAATLTAFDFYGQDGGEATYAATTVDPALTSSVISRGSGFVPDNSVTFTGNGFGFSPTGNPGHLYSTVAASGNQFVTFTVTPTAGNSLSLSSLAFGANGQNAPDDITGGLTYSTDGTSFTEVTSPTTSGSSIDGNSRLNTFDLSSIAALQGDTSAVTFRLYALADDVHNYQVGAFGRLRGQYGSYDNDGISLIGTSAAAATPEPATLGLLAGAALLCGRRRRQL